MTILAEKFRTQKWTHDAVNCATNAQMRDGKERRNCIFVLMDTYEEDY